MRVLIAYGPTREPLDPVRYLSNYSTGTMGKLLVQVAKKFGHQVTAVECPQDAQTARDLLKKLSALVPKHDVLIMNAAVCDVRPKTVSSAKIKKNKLETLKLIKNPDILATLAKKKKKGQIFIGFALESGKLLKNGLSKLRLKNLEVIYIQEVTSKISPFGKAKPKVHSLDRFGSSQSYGILSKERFAKIVILKAENLKMRGKFA